MQKAPKIESQLSKEESIRTLPKRIYCPVCSEKMLFGSLKVDEAQGAVASGALSAAKLSCGCGVNGVLTLRKTPDGLHLYSLTFWILPAITRKNAVLSGKEIRAWHPKIGQNLGKQQIQSDIEKAIGSN